jgi:hypothetical protein
LPSPYRQQAAARQEAGRLTGPAPRIVTRPIQFQGIITRDNVSVDVSAVAYSKNVSSSRRTS